MCLCDTADAPSAFQKTMRLARRDHHCCECHRPIRAGDRYEYASGIWDGSPGSYKTCLRCVRLRSSHLAAEEAGCMAVFGELIQTIGECAREDRGYLKAFRKAFREERV